MVINMEMAGICGTDKHTYKGEMILHAGTETEQRGVFPCVKGHKVVGHIAGINGTYLDADGVPLKMGDRVTVCPNIICKKCWYCRDIFGWPYCANNKSYGVYFRSDQPSHITGGWAEYMMMRYRDRFPWMKFVTHKFPLDQPTEAMKKPFEDESLRRYALCLDGIIPSSPFTKEGLGRLEEGEENENRM